MQTVMLRVENMHCGACVRRVLGLLNGLTETHAEEVRIGSAKVRTEQAAERVCIVLAEGGFPARVESAAS